ncbi:MAG: hypothetical protein JWP49_2131 [Phenylobacterium sp.]|nr:hypothetical protein [Phenylobacterium sp.]
MTDIHFSTSQEANLDRRLEELIDKMVKRTATQSELSEYRTLSAARTRMLRPSRPERPSVRAARIRIPA